MARLTAGVELSGRNFRQCNALPNFAHGACALRDWGDVEYKYTDCFNPVDEIDFGSNSAAIAIARPGQTPLPSEKDRSVQPLAALMHVLPVYGRGAR